MNQDVYEGIEYTKNYQCLHSQARPPGQLNKACAFTEFLGIKDTFNLALETCYLMEILILRLLQIMATGINIKTVALKLQSSWKTSGRMFILKAVMKGEPYYINAQSPLD